jgi:SAM-dependent methyltransferases related to tRNA (uracil-5-)-methyltransferase
MTDVIYFVVIIVILCFTWVCFFGAPFVPTRKKWAQMALDLVKLTKDDFVVDLGSGSGTILRLLADQKVRSIGYEINPILWAVSKIRFVFTNLTQVEFANFWTQDLPKQTTVVYVFAVVRDANKLEKYFEKQSENRSIKVITFGFRLPNKKIIKRTKGAFLYHF